MINIAHQTWIKIVDMYFDESIYKLKGYLQWYPFSASTMQEKLKSSDFFNTYIDNGYFWLNRSISDVQNNYMQKSDGSYRQSQLISPILFLVLQSLCKRISEDFTNPRPNDIEYFYSGDFVEEKVDYKYSYDLFYKSVNYHAVINKYYFKFDISNFYREININQLLNLVNKYSTDTNNEAIYRESEILFLKELIAYCGKGKFPIIENSMGTSFLASVVYLSESDCKLYNYFSESDNSFSDFKMIRYVDDLYVFFNSDSSIEDIQKYFIETQNFYSTVLHENDLRLNLKKTVFKLTKNISEDLRQSIYDELVNDDEFEINKVNDEYFFHFIDTLIEYKQDNGALTYHDYQLAIMNVFSIEGSELSPIEIYHSFLYRSNFDFRNIRFIEKMNTLSDIKTISVDPKRFTTMILNTNDESIIKKILRELFMKAQTANWTINDLDIALNYLRMRSFSHSDLFQELKNEMRGQHHNLHDFIDNYCQITDWKVEENEFLIKNSSLINVSSTSMYIYFLSLSSYKNNDYLASFAYFKSFFDRFSAELSFYLRDEDSRLKSPSYWGFYSKKNLKSFYNGIDDSEDIIENANNYRNFNPIAHASAELLNDKISRRQLDSIRSNLTKLMIEKLNDLS